MNQPIHSNTTHPVKSYFKTAFEYLLVALSVTMIFSRKLSSIVIVLLVITWVLSGEYRNIKQAFKNRFVVLFISIPLLLLVSLLFSTNENFSLVEKGISLW